MNFISISMYNFGESNMMCILSFMYFCYLSPGAVTTPGNRDSVRWACSFEIRKRRAAETEPTGPSLVVYRRTDRVVAPRQQPLRQPTVRSGEPVQHGESDQQQQEARPGDHQRLGERPDAPRVDGDDGL